MSKYYRCEFCGRKIKDDLCPYCGGVNSDKSENVRPDEKVKSEVIDDASTEKYEKVRKQLKKEVAREYRVEKKLTEKRSKLIKRSISIAIAAVVLIFLIVIIVQKNDYDMTHTETENVIDVDDIVFDLTLGGNSFKLTVPSGFNEISSNLSFSPPTIEKPENDPDGNMIYDIQPGYAVYCDDVYGVLHLSLYNNQYSAVPYTEGVCDDLTIYTKDNLTSVKWDGREVLVPAGKIIEMFGEPSYKVESDYSRHYDYRTTNGEISFVYYNSYEHEGEFVLDHISVMNKRRVRSYI